MSNENGSETIHQVGFTENNREVGDKNNTRNEKEVDKLLPSNDGGNRYGREGSSFNLLGNIQNGENGRINRDEGFSGSTRLCRSLTIDPGFIMKLTGGSKAAEENFYEDFYFESKKSIGGLTYEPCSFNGCWHIKSKWYSNI
ncbi:hypothetical protein SAMN05443428_11462 [Caloramator quimbayensis]|uniref:Uncharacterized protein n=1 Tax=Caloramator quimbayensis TaxID=1147123 RepID=A0A1T4XVY1_9CLOT|nr:hypothetical protein [Caloramator quimbayensis]SKA93680.1 hypothetical protein SAMN05443428_11462 [Caloramator quimbayensis]